MIKMSYTLWQIQISINTMCSYYNKIIIFEDKFNLQSSLKFYDGIRNYGMKQEKLPKTTRNFLINYINFIFEFRKTFLAKIYLPTSFKFWLKTLHS